MRSTVARPSRATRPRAATAALVLLAALACSHAALAAEEFAWPQGRQAAVSLGYDDALDSQLDIAIPALDRHGFKGSFYLVMANKPVAARLADWRAAAANGHELGNHTLFHQCSRSAKGHEWVEPQRDLDTTTAMQMKEQVLLASTMLNAIDGNTRRTLALPCNEATAQDGNYLALVADAFVGVRIGGNAITANVSQMDPAAVTVVSTDGMTGKQMIALVKEARRRHGLVSLTFHGVGGDYLTTSANAHDELLDYLARHRDVYWVDTFVNIMTHVRQQQAAVSNAPGAP
ncbi:polysaccharide deacetylase family protein [Lysobacter sp. S4-A87]|uniref:polysaccharide deacetylase family protein n=1 Tax=Lysobacter sp. S4-A87 TaxID=2925843 RepID=UPI001F52CDB3|nr:polysaccharide deacetylase family protein [Lysobacter sp. S4-A87]UNK48730.1 polysaccharide deacetylase family protein [Lysobacter sp. S4-A87]